jgi:type I restriction enzyme M protein
MILGTKPVAMRESSTMRVERSRSQAAAKSHYLQVTDEHFAQAAQGEQTSHHEAKQQAHAERVTVRHEAAIETAKQAKDGIVRKKSQAELRDYLNRMANVKTREARALLKEGFDYPIFLYEAEKVGITATGEPDTNELYPNDRMPVGMTPEETCLELYRRFCKTPAAFALEPDE